MKKFIGIVCFTMLFVVMTAAPAFADTGGTKQFIWPTRSNATAVLYMNTWTNLSGGRIDGRVSFFQGDYPSSEPHIGHVDYWYGKLWLSANGTGFPQQIGSLGAGVIRNTDFNSSHIAKLTTTDGSCHNGPPNDVVWVEWKYQIFFDNGAYTQIRDDNSYEWIPQPYEDCS